MVSRAPPPLVDSARATAPGRVLRVVLIYAVCAAAWIICSDLLLDLLVESASTRARLGVIKGGLFVAVTAVLLLFVLRGQTRKSADPLATQPAQHEGLRSLVWPLALVAAIVVAFTSASILFAYQHKRDDDASTLEAISELRLAQISHWLAERRAQAQFASTSNLYADLYRRWHDGGDAPSAERLMQRLVDFRTAGGAESVLVVDETGAVVASEVPAQDAPELRATALRAMASGKVELTPIYGLRGPSPTPRLDIVAPLLQTGTPARAAVVLRIDPQVFLFPTLEAWPFPTTAGATHLMIRDGDQALGFGKGRVLTVPLEQPDLLAGRFVRGEIPLGRATEGLDFRGVPVLGVLRAVPGTDWHLVAKIDRSEIVRNVLRDALWIVAGGLLALLAGSVGVYHLRHRQRLHLALLEREGQAEKLRALQLVEAITEGSTDRIYARDLDGRYMLINRAACEVIGRSRDEVLGHQVDPLNANDARVVAENRTLTFEEDVITDQGHLTHLVTKGPLHGADGKVIGLFGIARDITEQRRAEAHVRASEERLRLFVEHAPAAIAMFDRGMNYLAVSRRWLSDYALGERSLVGLNHYDVFPETSTAWKEVHQRCLATGAVEHSDGDPLARSDGTIDWVRWEIRPWHDEDGVIGGALLFSEVITERMRTEAALRESEKRLDLALSAAGMGVWEWNLRTDRVFWSREALMITTGNAAPSGVVTYTLQEFTERVMEEDREPLLARARTAVETHSLFSAEFRFRRLDGEVRWFSNLARAEYSAEGEPLRLIGTVHDITERKRMHAENERAAALVTATLDSTDNGILVADETGRVVMWNRRLLALVPELPEKVLRSGSRAAILEHLIHLFADREAVRRSGREIDRRPDYTDLSTVLLKDGRSIERFTQPMLIEGRVAGRVWSFRDVTARQRAIADAETRSRELEAKVRQRTQDLETAIAERTASDQMALLVANNMPGRVAYWSRDLECVFVNKAYCEFVGKSKGELVGRSMLEILGAERLDSVKERVRAALSGEAQRFEREDHGADGIDVITLVHFVPDRQMDGIRGFFVLSTDITEAKRAEQHLQELNDELTRARDRADAANRAKSAFLANMSHEIRTPMNAIIGFTHLLQRDLRTPAQIERLSKVDEAAHHLLTIINDILDLSKIESGKLTLEHTDFSLDTVLSRTCSLVADRARDKALELVVDSGRVPDMLRGDPTRLSQALLNLLSNAVKFTEKGMILLRADVVESEQDSVLVRFVVRDTGIGIAREKLGHLFDAFEQADASTTRRFGGTGLGLAITRRIAQVMGGDAGVESELNIGSTFWFTARLGRGAPLSATVANSPLAGRRVLVASDLAEARAATNSMLASLGMRTVDIASADEVLSHVKAADAGDAFDAVLLDANLTDANAVVIQLGRTPLRKAPVCVLMVDGSGGGKLRAAPGMPENLRLLAKPFTASSVHDCLLHALMFAEEEPQLPSPSSQAEELLRTRYTGARVLLAEDNPINQEVALSLLEAAGLSVDLAVDGAQAVEAAEGADYDLILLDVQMPVLDGLEAARRIRKLPGRAQTPILAMTANAFGEDRDVCLAAGMNEHIAKPVDVQTMYAALLRWLPHRTSAAPAQAAIATGQPALPVLERLADIPGFDAALGLRFCAGREESFVQVLQQFEALYSNSPRKLVDDLQAGRHRELHRFAHSLNGASGVVGAVRVQQLAAALAATLAGGRRSAEITDAAEQLQVALAALIQALRERLDFAPATQAALPPAPPTAELEAILDELDALLANADFAAGALYRDNAAAIRPLLGSALQTFEQYLRSYDYQQARDRLRAARTRIGVSTPS